MKYSIIYADPPWLFKTWSKKGEDRSASKHYNITSLEDLKSLPISSIANEDSVMAMWATYPNLKDAFELMDAWGFTYKTVLFTWVKTNKRDDTFFMGLGYYSRANPEICLLGTRGKPLKRQSKSVKNLVISKIRSHSQKPDEVRDLIVELFGDVPRIELFARTKIEGWDAWGDEIESDIKL